MLKGEKQSEEIKRKFRETKRLKMLSKYNWVFAEPYLDIEIDNGSANRKLNHITLRQFKENITNGLSKTDMIKQGIPKHLLQFFSNLCQGKIKVTEEDFSRDYKAGKTLEEIAETYNITREDLTYLRQLFDINRTSATYQNRIATEVPLTQRQKEIIYGSLMGDACYRDKKYRNSARFKQGEMQRDYVLWKYSEMQSVACYNSLKSEHYCDKRSGHTSTCWRFYTHANSDIEFIIKEFYKDEKKQITKQILDNLTPLSIAVWYMDDGTADWSHYTNSTKYTKGKVGNADLMLCTHSFSEYSCEIIIDFFATKYNIMTRFKQDGISSEGLPKYIVIIERTSNDAFVELIRPYILPMFMYKIDYASHINSSLSHRCEFLN